MYETILVPTDGSTAARKAVRHALDLAARTGGSVRALSVVDTGGYASIEASGGAVSGRLRAAAETAVEWVATAARDAGVDVETAVREGSPPAEIVADAEAAGADLIVMGTHGRRGIDRYLLGSVTERVVRTAAVPVLTVRTADPPD
jgi:nucleotide-binding universal stress UspA family protein